MSRPRLRYGTASLAALALGAAAAAAGDFALAGRDPGPELLRMLRGLLEPDLRAIDGAALIHTLAFAVLGVGLGGAAGLALAPAFPRLRAVRALAAGLRAVHELFWALLLMQVFGLGPLTGVLAIALPYAGLFDKVFAEMIEEAAPAARRVLPPGTGALSAFAYADLPDLRDRFGHYALYRLECGLRSTLVLGFIGLPTVGFELEASFAAGDFARAAALLLGFYGLVASRRLWARARAAPLLLAGAVWVLPAGLPGGDAWRNLVRFATGDIVPAPLRGADPAAGAAWGAALRWLGDILLHQALPGALATLVLAQVALCAAGLLALALFPLLSRRFVGPAGRLFGRVLLVVVRSTPDYILAYVLLQALGPSMLPAAIALALHNGAVLAYLLGRQADALAYRADAPRGLNLYLYEALPRLYGQFLAFALYRWEIILRESAIFGILGVATLGFYVDGAIAELRFDAALVLVLATAALSLAADALSRRLRRALRAEPRAETLATEA